MKNFGKVMVLMNAAADQGSGGGQAPDAGQQTQQPPTQDPISAKLEQLAQLMQQQQQHTVQLAQRLESLQQGTQQPAHQQPPAGHEDPGQFVDDSVKEYIRQQNMKLAAQQHQLADSLDMQKFSIAAQQLHLTQDELSRTNATFDAWNKAGTLFYVNGVPVRPTRLDALQQVIGAVNIEARFNGKNLPGQAAGEAQRNAGNVHAQLEVGGRAAPLSGLPTNFDKMPLKQQNDELGKFLDSQGGF